MFGSYFLSKYVFLLLVRAVTKNSSQRKRLGVVGELEFRQPITAAGFCLKVDVKNCCLALFVKLKLKHNRIGKVEGELGQAPIMPNLMLPAGLLWCF
jgi:hypothetical protein